MMKESQIKPKLKIYNINWSACWLNNCPTVVGQNMYLLLDTSIRIIENQHILNINLYNYHICSLYYLIMSAANYGVSYGAILVISVHCIWYVSSFSYQKLWMLQAPNFRFVEVRVFDIFNLRGYYYYSFWKALWDFKLQKKKDNDSFFF